jgi:hypothetical protein
MEKAILIAQLIPIDPNAEVPEPKIIGYLKMSQGIMNELGCTSAIVFSRDPNNSSRTKFVFTIGKISKSQSERAISCIKSSPDTELPNIEKRASVEIILRTDMWLLPSGDKKIHDFLVNLMSAARKDNKHIFILTTEKTADEILATGEHGFSIITVATNAKETEISYYQIASKGSMMVENVHTDRMAYPI